MKPRQVMIIAGETSGDMLAAELVSALRRQLTDRASVYSADLQPLQTGLEPRFFGAGGPHMKAAGVELAFDMTEHSMIGMVALTSYLKFRRLLQQLLRLAIKRQPDVIICVDFSGFNRRFAHAIRNYTRSRSDWFHDWQPKIVQYVSPQVWASRADRAYQIAEDYDLLLSIFPFEKAWYNKRVPKFRVEFVGHPMVERFHKVAAHKTETTSAAPNILLLPGSRRAELKRHLPVIIEAARTIARNLSGSTFRVVLPNDQLLDVLWSEFASKSGVTQSISAPPTPTDIEACAAKLDLKLHVQIGGLAAALAQADIAIAKTGTVATECGFFGVPTVTLYKTSSITYWLGRRLVKVKSLTMPNLLAEEEIFPEFIQDAATPENLSRAALELLRDDNRRRQVKIKLAQVMSSLGGPGANQRAAREITREIFDF